MNWNLRDAARALNMSEREVLRLAHEGDLPALRVNDQYMFNAVELHEWGTRRNHRLSPDVIRPNGEPEELLSLAAAIGRGGVYYDVEGTCPDEVFGAVAQLPAVPAHVDRTLLCDVLCVREALASTGIGAGIAIPHPRDPVVLHVDSPVILLCFLNKPVNFKSIDGQAVRILFTLLSPTIPLHLRMLARLAYTLHDDGLNHLLAERAPPDVLLARISEMDTHMKGSAKERCAK